MTEPFVCHAEQREASQGRLREEYPDKLRVRISGKVTHYPKPDFR